MKLLLFQQVTAARNLGLLRVFAEGDGLGKKVISVSSRPVDRSREAVKIRDSTGNSLAAEASFSLALAGECKFDL